MGCNTIRALTTLLWILTTALVNGQPSATITHTTTTIRTITVTITPFSDNNIPSPITMATTTIIIAAQPTPEISTGQSLIDKVLNSTNVYRTAFAAAPVTWNTTLADYADDYAQKCAWKHSNGPYGENLAAGYGSIALAIDGWGDEARKYSWSKHDFSEATGHFTQLVWGNTTSVGCGLVDCGTAGGDGVQGAFLVCEYWPRGNVEGEYEANVAKEVKGGDEALKLGGAAPGKKDGARSLAVLAVVACLCVSALMSL